MRPISPFSRIGSLRLQPINGRLLCRISIGSCRVPCHQVDRELVIVAAPTSPYLRHLIVYRPPVADEPPRAA